MNSNVDIITRNNRAYVEIENVYEYGKIYKIVNDINNNIYIGSTTKSLSQRFSLHLKEANKIKNNKTKLHNYINEIGESHFKIELVENYPCLTRCDLEDRERYYIKLLQPELNIHKKKRSKNVTKKTYILKKTNEPKVYEYDQGKYYYNFYEKNKQSIICETCGGVYNYYSKSKHLKSKKHNKREIESETDTEPETGNENIEN